MKIAFTILGEPASRITYIYALIDPYGEVRYVGKSDRPYRRFEIHLCDRADTRKGRWIRRLLTSGDRPSLRILEIAKHEEWQERERFWISRFASMRLTNSVAGGIGPLHPSSETRMKMRQRKLGRVLSDDHRRKVSAALKGKPKPPRTHEHIAKIAAARRGQSPSIEHRKKLAAANRKRPITASSGYRGVWFDRARGAFRAWVKLNGVMLHLGRYETAEQAAEVVQRRLAELSLC